MTYFVHAITEDACAFGALIDPLPCLPRLCGRVILECTSISFSLQLHCEPILKLALYRQASSGVRGSWEIPVVAKDRTENLVLQVVGKDKGKWSCNSGRLDLVTGLLIRH